MAEEKAKKTTTAKTATTKTTKTASTKTAEKAVKAEPKTKTAKTEKVAEVKTEKVAKTAPKTTAKTEKVATPKTAVKAEKSVAPKTVAKTEKVVEAKPATKTETKVASKPVASKPAKVEAKPATKEVKPAKVKTVKSKAQLFQGTGRRKCSVARVRVTAGTGNITVNDQDLKTYFELDTLIYIVKQPLVLTDCLNNVDVVATIYGGGKTGQAGALRHGITRALIEYRPELRAELKKAGLLARDSRKKERKKYGLKKARRAPQWRKR